MFVFISAPCGRNESSALLPDNVLRVGDDARVDGFRGCWTLFSTISCPPVLHFSVTPSTDSSSFDLASFVSTTSSAVRDAVFFSGSLTSHFFLLWTRR